MSSSPESDSLDSHTRKRVGKACDRCRLKKSKCDGASPCSRCKADNSLCVFGERKKSHDKVYPKGYVEMLEQQQHQMVAAIRQQYVRSVRSGTWEGTPLKEQADGYPLTHDILERLGVLHFTGDNPVGSEEFSDNLEALQAQLMEKNGVSNPRQRRTSPESESDHESTHYGSPHSSPSLRHSSVSSTTSSRKRSAPMTPPHSPTAVLPAKHAKFNAPSQYEMDSRAFEPTILDTSRYGLELSQSFYASPLPMLDQLSTFMGSQPELTLPVSNFHDSEWEWDSFVNSSIHPSFP